MLPEPRAIFIHNCLQVLGLTILYYDHYLTFPQEFKHIWRHPRYASASTFWFLLNRYVNFFGDIVVAVFVFMNLNSKWGLLNQHSTVLPNSGCHVTLARVTGIRIAIAWEALFALDTLIFALTIFRTWKLSEGGRVNSRSRHDIVLLITRDGALYFGVMALANLSNLVTFYSDEPALRGSLSTFASAISVSMCSRVILNLHESAYRNAHLPTTTFADRMLTSPTGLDGSHGQQLTTFFDARAELSIMARDNTKDIQMDEFSIARATSPCNRPSYTLSDSDRTWTSWEGPFER
ncbi:hypothetical protein PUNSTDRAFT_133951 [Punctularia strigosozonata HHB-11173 SS5]|uniref:uncharacterized protein n=1 Tax=Punctularia strigosozonata (strain HHB-11173) TaxID=741275 RepID=UPI000441824B|nr:uncharacterized protein PUNSTDRAFT_133951 [Punctularia strigosozonata HHB-11173 SS5]EIN08770.1 hypothetical protein PUNSTDRAFT_133951 [Punctularia strigosozonata HHB-11173 SS5]